MKKMFAKLGMPSVLSLAFLLGGLFFGANSAQAQTLIGNSSLPTAGAPIKISGNWKSVADAKTALNAEIAYLDQTLATSVPSGAVAMKMKLTIYSDIARDLEIGVEVGAAAYNNYYHYAPFASQTQDAHPATPGMSNGDWNNVYNDMLELLAQ